METTGLIINILSLVASGFGLWFSYRAFKEAGEAKNSADVAKDAADAAKKAIATKKTRLDLDELVKELISLALKEIDQTEILNFASKLNHITPIMRELKLINEQQEGTIYHTLENLQTSLAGNDQDASDSSQKNRYELVGLLSRISGIIEATEYK